RVDTLQVIQDVLVQRRAHCGGKTRLRPVPGEQDQGDHARWVDAADIAQVAAAGVRAHGELGQGGPFGLAEVLKRALHRVTESWKPRSRSTGKRQGLSSSIKYIATRITGKDAGERSAPRRYGGPAVALGGY